MWYSVGSGDTTQQQRCSTLCVWYSVGSGDTTQCTTQYSVCVYSTPYGHKVSTWVRSPRALPARGKVSVGVHSMRAPPAPGQVKPAGLPPAGGWKPCGLTLRALGARLRASAHSVRALGGSLLPSFTSSHITLIRASTGTAGCWWVVVWYRHTVHLPWCAVGTVDPCWSNPADPLYTWIYPPRYRPVLDQMA